MKLIIAILFVFMQLNVLAQEHARIINHETTYIIKNSRDVEIEENYTVLVNSEKGKDWGMFHTYSDKFRSVKEVRVVVKDVRGKQVKKLTKIDGIETGISPSYEVNDSKWLIMDPDYQQYPYMLEVSYRVKMNGFISLPVWVPQSAFNTTVDKSSLQVIVYPGQDVKVWEENIKMVSEKVNGDGSQVKIYQVTKLPHVDPTIRYKEFYQLQPKVHVAPVRFELAGTKGSTSSWKEFGDWFLELNSDPYVLKNDTKNFLSSLDKTDAKQVVEAVYNYMQDRTRYVSIQLGIGGFKSLPTESVETKGYGDCKALTTYMKNLLDYVGVTSNYVLVRAGSDAPDVIKEFPSSQFNHVFLGVPLSEDTLYLECTSQILPADYIGTFTDDRSVLWVSKNNSKIVRSRIYQPDDNRVSNFAAIAVDKNGDGNINLDTKNEGIFFDEIMVYKGAPEDYVKKINQKRFDHYKDFTIKKFTFNQEGRNTPVYNSSFIIEVPGLGKLVNEKLILPVNLLRPVSDYINYDEFMKYADIARGITVDDYVEIKTNDVFWPSKLPDEFKLSSKYGDYKLYFTQGPDKLIINRKFIFRKGLYTGDEFNGFMDTLKEIKKFEMKKIVLSSKT